jgi:hypothetical protein
MKKQSTSRSVSFNPRVLIGFVLCSIGILLALTGSSESVTGNPAATSAEAQNALFSLTTGTDNTAIGTSSLFRGQRATTKQSAVADPLLLGLAPVAALSNSDEAASGCWTATDSLNTARYYHTATLLPNGMVLVAGGWDGFNPFTSAELYDPGARNLECHWRPQHRTLDSQGDLAAQRQGPCCSGI